MKAGIVSASALTRHNRWDVKYYLGHPEPLGERVVRAEAGVRRANSRLRTARKQLADEQARAVALVESGDVVPFGG